MDSKQLKELIIIPTLNTLGLHSPSSVNLLLGTAAQESQMGQYIKQIKGPALGIYQMEPATHDDIVKNYLAGRGSLVKKIKEVSGVSELLHEHLMGNLWYSTAFARIHYYRVPERLPDATDMDGLARYWKRYYNTPLGKGTEEEFIHNYQRYVK